MTKVRIGVNPIKWSNDDFRDLGGDTPLEQCLSEAREAGYDGIEVGHKLPKNPAELKPLLARHGLALVSGWHSSYLLDNSYEQEELSFRAHLTFLKSMGCTVAIIAECARRTYHDAKQHMVHASGETVLTSSEWQRLCAGLEMLATVAKKEGMVAAYHHHMGTVVQDESQLHRLMDGTNNLMLTADTGHMAYGGMDPVAMFKRYSSRIAHVHFKDVRANVVKRAINENLTFEQAVKAGVFTVPGDGDLDFKAVSATLSDYTGWLVVEAEQDPKKANPFEYAKKGRAALKELGWG